MPRKRFSGLEATLRNITVIGGTAAPVPPANTRAANYLAYKAKGKKYDITKTVVKGKGTKYGLDGFGSETSDPLFTVVVGKRAGDKMDDVGLTVAGLGLGTTDLGIAISQFEPARIIVTVSSGEAALTANPSAITGEKYKRKPTIDSYTFPFGVTTTNTTEFKARKALLALVAAKSTETTQFTATFKAENLYQR